MQLLRDFWEPATRVASSAGWPIIGPDSLSGAMIPCPAIWVVNRVMSYVANNIHTGIPLDVIRFGMGNHVT